MLKPIRRVYEGDPSAYSQLIHFYFFTFYLWTVKKSTITRGDNEPYLVRYSLLNTPWFSVKLHHILSSDDECLHDHPWSFISVILKGHYYEANDGPMRRCGRGSILFRRASWRHRLIINRPVWTFVITFRKTKEWGFFTKNGYVHHRRYNSKMCE